MASDPGSSFKMKALTSGASGSAFRRYRDLVHGDQSLLRVFWSEWIQLWIGGIPGALGLLLRQVFYPSLFAKVGKKVVFGRNLTLRHAHKMELGNGVILDDGVVLDAKGQGNAFVLGNGVYVGRNSILYCKGGNLHLDDRVNLSSNCQLFSSNDLRFGKGVVVGAFSYFLSGGAYDLHDPTPFALQSGMQTRGPTVVGDNVWVAAHVCVLDGVEVGRNVVIGAGSVVNRSIPDNCIALGVPARVQSTRPPESLPLQEQ
jgi:acetyltransferase-like isoleucine patch superfamily enzyme